MTSNFISYLHHLLHAPVIVRNVDGYTYELQASWSVLCERTASGTVADMIYNRLKRCSKIEAVSGWDMNKIYVRFRKNDK